MASHFVSLQRGEEGSDYNDFTTGTSSTAGDNFEFRLLDDVPVRPVEVLKALKAFERFFENRQQWVAGGFIING
jgi:hypothetical protein